VRGLLPPHFTLNLRKDQIEGRPAHGRATSTSNVPYGKGENVLQS